MKQRSATTLLACSFLVGACGDKQKPDEPPAPPPPSSSTVKPAATHADPFETPKRKADTVASLGGEPDLDGVAVDGEDVYVALRQGSDEVVVAIPGGDGKPKRLGTLGGSGNANLRIIGDRIAWTDRSNVLSMPKAGGDVHREPFNVLAFAGDGKETFGCNERALTKLDGSDPPKTIELAKYTDAHGCSIALDDGNVFFSYAVGPLGSPSTTLMRVDRRAGGEPAHVVDGVGIGSFAIDDRYVYWTKNGSIRLPEEEAKSPPFNGRSSTTIDGQILRVEKKGGSFEVLAKGELSPRAVLVDDQAIYWDSAIGIRKMPKSGGPAELWVSNDDENRYWRSGIVATKKYLYWLTMEGELLRAEK